MGNYSYQIDYGEGHENAYPDGDLANDYEKWFDYIEKYDDGRIIRARVLLGNQELEERVFKK